VGDRDGRVRAIEVVKTRLGEFDRSGRRRPVPTDEILRFDCDTVILAVGETVDLDFARASGLKIKDNGTIEVDRYTMESSRSKFYAGGDVISGASNVSNAMGYGKKAARNIDHRLMGERRIDRIAVHLEIDETPPERPSEARRHTVHELPAAERVKGFGEAVAGLTEHEALEEACRCLRCDVRGHE
jgi:NADH-quinone oxidoreductase subunit F